MTKSTRTNVGRVAGLMLGLVLGLPLVLAPGDAAAEYRNLCISSPSACEYTGPDAPKINVDVCYGSTIGIQLKTGACPSGSWPYHVDYGVVDPLSNQVAAYNPLDDACAATSMCLDYVPHDDGWESTICCVWYDDCYEGVTCGGVLFWCFDGVSNLDGTVTCFDIEEL